MLKELTHSILVLRLFKCPDGQIRVLWGDCLFPLTRAQYLFLVEVINDIHREHSGEAVESDSERKKKPVS